jgi:hypothetical protein
MIYDQSFCYLCVGAGNVCLHRNVFKSYGNQIFVRQIDQFNVTAAIMVQRLFGVKICKQDGIAFVNTVMQFFHRGSYAHIVTVVRKFS